MIYPRRLVLCLFRDSPFRGEQIFEINDLTGRSIVDIAPRAYCFDHVGERLLPRLTGETSCAGRLVGRVLFQDQDQIYLWIPGDQCILVAPELLVPLPKIYAVDPRY